MVVWQVEGTGLTGIEHEKAGCVLESTRCLLWLECKSVCGLGVRDREGWEIKFKS